MIQMSDVDVLEYVKNKTVKRIPEMIKDDCRKIILYGSYARGDYTDDSDVDIAILTDCDRIEAKKYSDQIDDLAAEICIDTMAIVNFVFLPYEEFENKKTWYPYFTNISRDGVLIYEQ